MEREASSAERGHRLRDYSQEGSHRVRGVLRTDAFCHLSLSIKSREQCYQGTLTASSVVFLIGLTKRAENQ